MAIQKTTYKDQVMSYIYDLLLDGKLNPGDQIKESHLAKEMGISRAPIREALKELISNGIVDYKPQVGNYISLLSPKEIVDAYTARGVLEGYAVMETMLQFSDYDIARLKSMASQMKLSAQNNDNKMVTEIGGDFHDLLVSKNDNFQLIRFTNRLSLKLHILFNKYWAKLYTPEEIENRHLEIACVVERGVEHSVEKVIREHYIESGQKIAELQIAQEEGK